MTIFYPATTRRTSPQARLVHHSAGRNRSPSLPTASDSTIAVAATTEPNGPRRSTVTGRTRDQRPRLPARTRGDDDQNLGSPGRANVTLSDVRKEARLVRGGHRVTSGA